MFLDYQLPPELIAQRPAEPRDAARLLVVRRTSGQLEHRRVADIAEYMRAGDLLVVNDTKVLPARLLGKRSNTGGKWEGLYLGADGNGHWELLCQTRGTLGIGERVDVGLLQLTLIEREPGRPWKFRPECPGTAAELLLKHGQVPLPPYIRKGIGDEADRSRYQTVYAASPGAAAAPTAGLHFTPELLAKLAELGVERAAVTLHVGLGTFQPLTSDDPEQHRIHREWCECPARTVAAIGEAKRRGGRVIAVGTTTVRTLESAARGGELAPWKGETDLYVRPPYEFKVVDALMTNFHLPRTSLLLLVAAFVGEHLLRAAYEAAVAERYRFYSYGDAMLVI